MSLLGLNSGYTVKYGPLPLGVPSGKGLYLTIYPLSRPNTDPFEKMHLIYDRKFCYNESRLSGKPKVGPY